MEVVSAFALAFWLVKRADSSRCNASVRPLASAAAWLDRPDAQTLPTGRLLHRGRAPG